MTFNQNTYVLINRDTNTYNINGDIKPNQFLGANVTSGEAKTPFIKGDKIPVDEYIWSNKGNKAELYYHLTRSNGLSNRVFDENNKDNMTFIKAAAGQQYLSGSQLTPINTAKEAKADAKIAAKTDKTELQKLLDQEANANYKQFKQPNYDAALAYAKKVNDSNTASTAEVKQITQVLKQQELALLSADKHNIYDATESTMPE